MIQETKDKLKHHFNTLKAMGYEYSEAVDFHIQDVHDNMILPNNIDLLESMALNCNLCDLSKNTKKKFFAKGNSSKVMFIGDYPLVEQFNPFQGQAGKMLEAMCTNVLGVGIEEIYYTTIVKCNISTTQNIHKENVLICKDYLLKQITLINPTVIIIFDTDAYKYISSLNIFDSNNVIKIYSPTFLLRNPSYKKQALLDLQKAKTILNEAR
jgi:DNA polymerase